MVIPTEQEIFYQDFNRKALLLVIPTELEIFYQDFNRKSLLLVIPTVLEIFWQDLYTKALLLVIPTVLGIFWHELHSFYNAIIILLYIFWFVLYKFACIFLAVFKVSRITTKYHENLKTYDASTCLQEWIYKMHYGFCTFQLWPQKKVELISGLEFACILPENILIHFVKIYVVTGLSNENNIN